MAEKRFNPYKHEIKRLKTLNQELLESNAKIRIENKQLKQYKKAIFDCDSSKIIRVNKNTNEVDLVDKEIE